MLVFITILRQGTDLRKTGSISQLWACWLFDVCGQHRESFRGWAEPIWAFQNA